MNCYEKTALRERLVDVIHKLANVEALLDYNRTMKIMSPETLWLELSLTRDWYDDLLVLATFAWRAEHMGHPSKDEVLDFMQIDMNLHYKNRKSRRISELLIGEEN